MKKLLLLLLALLLLCSVFAGCKKDDDKNKPDGNQTKAPDNTSTDADEPAYELPLKDLGMEDGSKREMTILMPQGRIMQFDENEANADTINEAIVKRNDLVESKLNCALYYYNPPLNASIMTTMMTAEMLNQTGDYDIVFYEYWWNQEVHGYFYNLRESEILALDQPFYNNSWNDAATIRGTLNSLTGYGSIEMMQRTVVTVFNKSMYNSLFTTPVYDYVHSGDWTLETMEIMAKEAYSVEEGGTEVYNYGLTYDLWAGRAMLFTMGGKVAVMSETEDPIIEYASENNLQILQEMQRFWDETYTNFNREDAATDFVNKKTLFSMTTYGTVENIRKADSGVTYGLLPYPKLNLEQKDYISTNTGCSTWSIPVTVESRENAEYLLNTFHYYSAEHVKPAYFDNVLKGRLASSPDDAEMIDITMDNIYMDFAFIQDTNLSTGCKNDKGQDLAVCNGTFEIIRGNVSKDFSSFYAENDALLKQNLATFIEQYVNGSGSAA